mgnify:FL=1
MTLFKQLAFVVSLVYLLIVITLTLGDFRRSGDFIEGQLQTTAQDMATTLGIAISNLPDDADVATYETLFNAVFDSGYYASIELESPDGELILRKDQPLSIQGVPDWFIQLVPLQPAAGATQIMKGWSPLGTLRLTLHPGYMYASLYQNLQATLLWFLLLFTLGMAVLWWLLHRLMRPLDEVKAQADAIHNNQFVQQSVIPRTVELRSVVEAMNRMVSKVHMIFDDQESTLQRYQKLLYEDELTGLGNRQFFIAQLERALSEDASFHGALVVIKVNGLDAIRERFGYAQSETIVKTLAQVLLCEEDELANEICARLKDDEFALLIPSGMAHARKHVDAIFEDFRNHADMVGFAEQLSLNAGICSVDVGRSIGETLSDSDYALTQAAAGGAYSVSEKVGSQLSLPQGKMQWRAWLEACIRDGRLFLVRQNVLDNAGRALHQEVFVRLRNEENQVVPAGMFMPMANALGMGEDIDREVFRLVRAMRNRADNVPFALNLTRSVFSHADALLEFNQLLSAFQEVDSHLCVEASHAILEQYPAMCAEVAESVRRAGHAFGVDNLNLGRSLQVLQSVRPDYVKVNAKTLYDMTSGDVPAGYQALLTLTRAMDIQLIAVGVDSQDMRDHLQALGVDGMQGNLLAEAEDLL